MSALEWQKSSFSAEAANCVYVAATPDDTVRVRESDEPGRILSVSREALCALLASVKEHPRGE
ncbi:DUF397 domain-containing protein [Streptomyces sp. DSM 118878]